MAMSVDHSRQQRRTACVDHLGPFWIAVTGIARALDPPVIADDERRKALQPPELV